MTIFGADCNRFSCNLLKYVMKTCMVVHVTLQKKKKIHFRANKSALLVQQCRPS